MPGQEDQLPSELVAEMTIVIPFLLEKGWEIFEFSYEPQTSANWYIDFFRSDLTIRLVKDRSQYSVDGAQAELDAAGMPRVFTDATEFQKAVIEWIKHLATNAKNAQQELLH